MRRAALVTVLLLCLAAYADIKPHVFALPVVALLWALYVLGCPDKPCWRCSGWASRARRGKRSACPRCKGTGKTFRLSARLVHRGAALAVRTIRERREGGQ